jgi:hypothetical protein
MRSEALAMPLRYPFMLSCGMRAQPITSKLGRTHLSPARAGSSVQDLSNALHRRGRQAGGVHTAADPTAAAEDSHQARWAR